MDTYSDGWYQAQKIADGVWRIDEHGQANFYAAIGRKYAVMIDNGWGAGNLPKLMTALSTLPWFTINTHGDIDHALGNCFFETAFIGAADLPMLTADGADVRRAQIRGNAQTLDVLDSSCASFGGCPAKKETKALTDGQRFDLGGRVLTAWAVPGHTAGSFCFLDDYSRILFAGDMYVPLQEWNAMWMHMPRCTSLETMLASIERMHSLRTQYDRMVSGHGDNCDLRADRLEELAEGLQMLIHGTISGDPVHTPVGDGLEILFSRCGLVYDPARLRG